jgi:hypothetical protein
VENTVKLPNYKFRDDGLKNWTCILDFVTAILDTHYETNGDVAGDREVQAWAEQCCFGLKHAKNVPTSFLTKVGPKRLFKPLLKPSHVLRPPFLWGAQFRAHETHTWREQLVSAIETPVL